MDVLSLLGALLVIVLVLGGSYFFTRWAGTRLNGGLLPPGIADTLGRGERI